MKHNENEKLLSALKRQQHLAEELRQGHRSLAAALTDVPVAQLLRRERRGYGFRLVCLVAFAVLATDACTPAVADTTMRLSHYASSEQAYNDTYNLLHHQ